MTFNSNGYTTATNYAVGLSEEQDFTYTLSSSGNFISSYTDGLGRAISYAYDSKGNVTSITQPIDSSTSATTSYSYDSTFNQLTAVTDPLSHSWTISLDAYGNATSITDPLSHTTNFGYSHGLLSSVTTHPPSGDSTWNIGHRGGDTSSITDPLGNFSNIFTDQFGRVAIAWDPL